MLRRTSRRGRTDRDDLHRDLSIHLCRGLGVVVKHLAQMLMPFSQLYINVCARTQSGEKSGPGSEDYLIPILGATNIGISDR